MEILDRCTLNDNIFLVMPTPGNSEHILQHVDQHFGEIPTFKRLVIPDD